MRIFEEPERVKIQNWACKTKSRSRMMSQKEESGLKA